METTNRDTGTIVLLVTGDARHVQAKAVHTQVGSMRSEFCTIDNVLVRPLTGTTVNLVMAFNIVATFCSIQ